MFKKYSVIIFIFITFSLQCFAEKNINDYETAKDLTKLGISYLLNFEFDDANRLFDDAIKKFPEYPQPYISKSALPLWKFLFSKSTEDYNEALKNIDRAIEIAEKYSEKNQKDVYALTSLGIAYGNRVFLKLRNENFLGTIFDLRKSYKALSEAVKIKPDYYDAYLGLGIYHFSIGSLPKTLKWIVSLLGFEGNVEKGLREIELAAKRGELQKIEAAFYLTQFYPWFSGDFDKAKQIIDDLLKQYPQNQIFLYTRGVFNINQNNVNTAMDDFIKIENQKLHPIPRLLEYTKFRLGECNFRMGNYENAVRYYRDFLKFTSEEIYTPQAYLNAGISMEFLNKRNEALIYYKKAVESKSKHSDDLYAIEKAKIFLKKSIERIDSLIIIARNFHKKGDYNVAIEIYSNVIEKEHLTQKQIQEILYYLGECYYDGLKYKEAETSFKKILQTTGEKENWLIPWSKFYLGQINYKTGKLTEARNYFNSVLEHNNYLNERWLRFRTERILQTMQ